MGKDSENALVVSNRNSLIERKHIDEIIGTSTPVSHLVEMILRIAPSNLSVLITGESGVGKQVVAEAIHTSSGRRGPFVDTHCASFSPTLLEDELFGHEKGAFTGAISAKKGIFEKANGGTLFLDEIGEIDSTIQVKLLKVLEEKCFTPLGSDKEIKSDFRLISATNRDLKKEVSEGRFREDLYYRINKMSIEVPPLRERKGDIGALATSFLNKYKIENNKKIDGFTEDAYSALLCYRWPGNIRELQNVIEVSTVLARGNYITLLDLPDYIQKNYEDNRVKEKKSATYEHLNVNENTRFDNDENDVVTYENPQEYVTIKLGTLKDMERELIKATLEYYGGNKTRAAEALGITRKTLAKSGD